MNYPQWTGNEPCRTVDPELYFYTSLSKMRPAVRQMLAEMCNECPSREPCLMWALRHEAYGYWSGTTDMQRDAMRKTLGISLTVLAPGIDDRRRVA